eukprot:TRINITY_DN4625_c0_g1_i1.p2 TRINITY_DN4625_c0_g1~~TRINITY_DN4625_c0_g1_i1.p2  ORF type:complete len:460 (-),score=75.79 TRINITY_DN4625_c0_g1_i1:17-1396(-)
MYRTISWVPACRSAIISRATLSIAAPRPFSSTPLEASKSSSVFRPTRTYCQRCTATNHKMAFVADTTEGPAVDQEVETTEEAAEAPIERRKLATVVKVDAVLPHGNADRLAIARVRGWQVIVGKDEFLPGDLAVYCEIDSKLPEEILTGGALEAMRAKKFVVKTIKLRGQLSQGILLPLACLDLAKTVSAEGLRTQRNATSGEWSLGSGTEAEFVERLKLEVGVDVTHLLGVTKHEPVAFVIPQYNLKVRTFPLHLAPRTDEERVQNIPHLLAEWRDLEFYVTEKVDGSSFTCFLAGDRFGVCSRNYEVVETEGNLFWSAAKKLQLEQRLRASGKDRIVLQGELLGPQIQKNRYNLPEHMIRWFTVYDSAGKRDYPIVEAMEFVQSLGLEWAPVIHRSFLLGDKSVDDLLQMAEAPSQLNPKVTREGLVFRAVSGASHAGFGRISFKAISNAYLLKYDT